MPVVSRPALWRDKAKLLNFGVYDDFCERHGQALRYLDARLP